MPLFTSRRSANNGQHVTMGQEPAKSRLYPPTCVTWASAVDQYQENTFWVCPTFCGGSGDDPVDRERGGRIFIWVISLTWHLGILFNHGRLAKAQRGWIEAENRNNCRLISAVVDVPQFREFANEIRYPPCILDEQFIASISFYDEQMLSGLGLDLGRTSRPNYRMWTASLTEDETEGGDPYNLERWRYVLHKSWASHFRTIFNSGNDAEIRNGFTLGQLKAQALKAHLADCLRRKEREIFLPAHPHVTKADILMTMDLPRNIVTHLSTLENLHIFASEVTFGELVTFVAEARCSATAVAEQQLTLDLCSVQHQRRALGFEDGQIFGATVVGNYLRMYRSKWANDKVIVTQTKPTFMLDTFPAFVDCFLFLCRVSNYVSGEVDRTFRECETEEGRLRFEERSRDASARDPWRLAARPWSTTSPGSSAQGAMEPQDWELGILRWRTGVKQSLGG